MKHVDALVLVGFAENIASQASFHEADELSKNLHRIEHEQQWPDGQPITEEDRNNVLASAVFINLGKVVMNRILRLETVSDLPVNPFLDKARLTVDAVSPYASDEAIDPIALSIPEMLSPQPAATTNKTDMAAVYSECVVADSNEAREFAQKMEVAIEIYRRRGKSTVERYAVKPLLDAIRALDTKAIPPEAVSFGPDLEIRSETRSVGDIVARTGVTPRQVRIPYYQTFRSNKNGVLLLDYALEDIQELGERLAVISVSNVDSAGR